MAHVTLAYLSVIFNWHASRDDDFRSPIVRGMGRVKPKERARERTLTDEEIRDVWAGIDAATDARDIPDCSARLLRALLLTALRRGELADAVWQETEDLERDGFSGDVLTIPSSRMKGKRDHALPLTPAVLALIGSRPKNAKSYPFMFSTMAGETPFSGFGKAKTALDSHIAEIRRKADRDPMPGWVLHDLCRTAKTLMTRAGVRPDISERVLAHAIPGVEGVYDRWAYLPEKHDALTRLAALVDRVIHQGCNVTSLDEHRAFGRLVPATRPDKDSAPLTKLATYQPNHWPPGRQRCAYSAGSMALQAAGRSARRRIVSPSRCLPDVPLFRTVRRWFHAYQVRQR